MADFNTGYKHYTNRGLYIINGDEFVRKELNLAGTNFIPDVQDVTMCPTPVAVPAHPTGISAIEFMPDTCNSYIRIAWTASTGASYYRVKATIDSAGIDYVQTGGTDIDLPFTGSTCTEVSVAACNQVGCSIYQPLTVNISNSNTTAPGIPESFDVEIHDGGNDYYTTIGSWKNEDCALYYEYAGHISFAVDTVQDTSAEYFEGLSIGNTTSNLQPRLRACNNFGCSAWSPFGGLSADYPPNRPTATLVSTTGFTLHWNSPYSPKGTVTGYKIYRNGSLYTTVGSTVFSLVITGESAYSTSKWTVAATIQSNPDTLQSAYLELTLYQSDTEAPTKPKNLFAQNIENTEFKLYWTESTDNIGVTNYQIFLGGVLKQTVPGVYSSTTIIGLTKNTAYTVTVKALDGSGNVSPVSDSLIVTTTNLNEGVPDPPTGLTSADVQNTTFTIGWNTPGDDGGSAITGYRIFKNGTQEAAVGLVNSYNITGQTAGATSPWTMKTINANGDSAVSGTLNVTQTNNAGFTSFLITNHKTTGVACDMLKTRTKWHDGTGAYPVNGTIIYNTNSAGDKYNGQDRIQADASRKRYAIDGVGLVSGVTACPADGVDPSKPENLVAENMTSTGFRLDWSTSTDNDKIAEYKIYKDTVFFATTGNDNSYYDITGLSTSDNSDWTVQAYDPTGNSSLMSDIYEVRVGRKSFSISTTGESSGSAACALTTYETRYFAGSASIPLPGNGTIYANQGGNTLFNGLSDHWKFPGSSSSNVINGLGKVTSTSSC